MKDEIKEILDKITDEDWYEEKDLTGTKWIELKQEETNLLYDYITYLQEENKRLNNIIEEFNKWLEQESNFWKEQQEKAIERGWLEFGGKYNTTIIYENAKDKLKELKEGK